MYNTCSLSSMMVFSASYAKREMNNFMSNIDGSHTAKKKERKKKKRKEREKRKEKKHTLKTVFCKFPDVNKGHY